MRNLELRVGAAQVTGLSYLDAWCKDTDTGLHYGITACGQIYRILQPDGPELIADLSAEGYLGEAIGADVVGFVYLPDLQSLLVGLASGLLIQVGVADMGEIEEVGGVAAGLLALCLSPDSELVTLVTADLKLVIMTRDYTPLSETSIQQEGFGEADFVNVGWGKKETQFHGTEGKEARVRAAERGILSPHDDGRARVVWRGDGQMLVVSYVKRTVADEEPVRKLRVFDRAGNLYSTSEDCPGLEHSLAWRPSGNLVAAAVRRPAGNRHVVAFFEKNGLQHGELQLRETTTSQNVVVVRELQWNCDSSVLAVWLKSDKGNYVQFWSMSNYHWYLKQSLSYPPTCALLQPRWDPEDPGLFSLIVSSKGEDRFETLQLSWTTAASRCQTDVDAAVVAVVDGNILKVTPFRETVIPPPMSAYEIAVGGQIDAVLFPPVDVKNNDGGLLEAAASDPNSLAVITDGSVFVFTTRDSVGEQKTLYNDCSVEVKITGAGGTGYTVHTGRHRLLGRLEIALSSATSANATLLRFTNWLWSGEDQLMASFVGPDGPAIIVFKEAAGRLIETERLGAEAAVYQMVGGIRPGEAVIQLETGAVLTYREGLLRPEFTFPRLCSKIISTEAGILGLNDRFRLYLNEREVATNITSVFLHSDFLLATTLDHRLIALPRAQLGVKGSPQWEEAVGARRLERGSRLVTAVAKHSRTVLQMPRGNLETIQPRSLTILLLTKLLDNLQYHEAFLLARRQRINLNLLVDHDKDLFMQNIHEFVKQVGGNGGGAGGEADRLAIFLAELRSEDTTTTMYAAQYANRHQRTANINWQQDKVEMVCQAVRQALEQEDPSAHHQVTLLPILATLVREGNKVQEALFRIKKIRDAGLLQLAGDGLRFILYSVDVNVLFDLALGTYDFDLVLMVAEKSQKDPKEYLPILNNYKAMPENYMKYSIDKQLKRWESALTHISKCEDKFAECLELVENQRLYKQALALFPATSDNYKSIALNYAAYLDRKRYYHEASLLYERAGSLELAVGAAERAGIWRRAVHLAGLAGWTPGSARLVELLRSLAGKLEGEGKGEESATIHRELLQDPEEAIAVLSRCRCWDEALRQAWQQGRSDLVETHVLPALREQRNLLDQSIQATAQAITTQVNRLLEVRKLRTGSADDHGDDGGVAGGEDNRNLEDADLFSDTTSVGGSVASSSARSSRSTLATRQTNRSKSAKNRRKQDRKLYSTREGSEYEDLGLIVAIHEALSTIPGLQVEVMKVIRALIEVGEEAALSQLQDCMEQLLSTADGVLTKVWPGQMEVQKERFGPEATVEDIVRGGVMASDTAYRSPLELLEPHLRYPPLITKIPNWKLEIL